MRCRVEITDSAPQEEYRRPVSYHNFSESGEARMTSGLKVTGIQAQRKVWTGGEVPVYVTVTNYLDHEKVANVVLQDYTKNVLIGERELIIPPQTAKTLTFYWQTRGFSLGDHVLHAEAVSDPEPYYEYDRIASSRIEQADHYDRGASYAAPPRRDNELEGIISEAEEILRRVDREWEEASQAHDRATAEADRILDDADERAYEERRQAQRDAEERARAILDDACQKAEGILNDAEAIQRRAEDYKTQMESEAAAYSTQVWEELRDKAEGDAQQIRDEAVRNAEDLMEEVRKQLEAAKAIRELAKELSGIAAGGDEIDLPAAEPVAEAPVAEAPATDDTPSDDTPHDYTPHMLPKDPTGFAGFYQRHRPAPAAAPAADETEGEAAPEAESRAAVENEAAPGTENTAASAETAAQPGTGLIVVPAPEAGRGWSFRWQHAVIALALVAAAVLLSVGLVSMG